MRKRRLLFAAAALAAAVTGLGSAAQAKYPEKLLTLIVPYAPGGITDIAARHLADKLKDSLKQPVIVENKTGAGGTIGSAVAAKSQADGYTLLMGTSATHGTNPSTYANLSYDAQTDFEPVALVAEAPLVLVVPSSASIKSVSDLIGQAKARPGELSYASTGVGGSIHLTVELLKTLTGTDLLHVPYKGSAPALNDLMGGHVSLMFDNMPSALPLARGGKLRALAVTSSKRSALAPDLPTVSESGVPGFTSGSWVGIFVPKNTPAPVIATLNAAINEALKSEDLRKKYLSVGLEPLGGSPEDFARHVDREIATWAKVAKQAGITPQ